MIFSFGQDVSEDRKLKSFFGISFDQQTRQTDFFSQPQNKSKGEMNQLIHALGMTLRESVSNKVAYKVILAAHFEAIV